MSVHDCLVGAAGTAAPPERTPIKNLPQISQMCTDQGSPDKPGGLSI